MVRKYAKQLILLVEDDQALCRVYAKALRDRGYIFLTAETGEQGLSLLSQHAPRLVLLDINLPGINGIDVCRRSRGLPGANAPVIFITSNDTVDVLHQCIEAGGDDFILKGDTISSLLERVNYWSRGNARRITQQQRSMILSKTENIVALNGRTTLAEILHDTVDGAQQSFDSAQINRIRDAFQRQSQKWPDLSDKSTTARIRRFGYVTGLVNAAAKESLDMKLRFIDYLRHAMIACGVAEQNGGASMIGRLSDFYGEPAFSDACGIAEKDFHDMFKVVHV